MHRMMHRSHVGDNRVIFVDRVATLLLAHNFIQVGLISQTSRTNNKGVISTFKCGYPPLTLNKGPKFISDHSRRIQANDLL